MADPRWLLVSKPLRRPFADGSSVLVRTLVEAMPTERPFAYFGDPAAPLRPSAHDQIIARAAMGHAPSMAAKVGVLGELMRPKHRRKALHFFFTPNPITSRVVTGLRKIRPARRVVQNIMSAASVESFVPHLRHLDAVVVLSDHTRERIVAAGMRAEQVHRIYPGVPRVEPERGEAPRRLLYAGDLDPQTAERLVACARVLPTAPGSAWTMVLACRPKGEGDAEARKTLRRELAGQLESGQVELHGHVDDFDGLVRSCGCQLYAADHVRKKVDLPLAVLEGLARGLGLLALDFRPLNEIFDRADALGFEVGARLPAQASAAGLAAAFVEALPNTAQLARWRADATELVQAHFSAAALVSAYQELYEHIDVRHG